MKKNTKNQPTKLTKKQQAKLIQAGKDIAIRLDEDILEMIDCSGIFEEAEIITADDNAINAAYDIIWKSVKENL